MKNFYFLPTILLFAFCLHSKAQTNSVNLKDGGGVLISSHASIGEAYGAIPATLSQAYIIEIENTYTGASETYPITFVAKTGASAANTITLRPAAGAASILVQASQPGGAVLNLNDADYVILDGRPGGTGNVGQLTFSNLGTTSSSNTVTLTNGASFNQLRYCTFLNSTTGSAGRGLFFGTSAANPTGNSDNLVEYCKFLSGRYLLNSSGTSANPNRNNVIFGCEFTNVIFVAIWSQAGTGKLTIDSCSIYNTTTTGQGAFGILYDGQTDTTIIRNNRIYDLFSTGTVKAINIRSVSGVNHSIIYNNFVSLTSGNGVNTTLIGIEYTGSNPTSGRVVHNSVRIGGVLNSGGSAGAVGSAAFYRTASNVSNIFEIENNLFVNERTGGTAGLQHIAMAATNISGTMNMDYNTYNGPPGFMIRWGTDLYTTFAPYQAVRAPGNEVNSNDAVVNFVSLTDLHLTGASIGNAALLAPLLPDVLTDIDQEPRSAAAYRGADEAIPIVFGCSGTPNPGNAVAGATSVCSGGNVSLSLSGLSIGEVPSLSFQWITSLNGVNFTVSPGDTNQTFSTSITQPTYFACIVTCSASGLSDTSGQVLVSITPLPSVASISETHTLGQYTFTANGVQNVTGYSWNFGNGNTSTLPSPTHTYTTGGAYTVTLIVTNACGADTASLPIFIGCEGTPSGGTISSNAQSVCLGQDFTLQITGLNPLISPTLSLQWQSSTDGVNFNDIPGADLSPYTTNISETTFFRCEVTCTLSGQSAFSNIISVNFIPVPVIGSISETHNGGEYQFTANGLQNASSVFWNFGNGAFGMGSSPSYTYAAGGTFTVTATATNACGSDTATLLITVGCEGAPDQATAQAISTDLCTGDDFTLSLTGLDAAQAVFYEYQWQQSTDGNTFTDINGANNSDYNATAGTHAFFRCLVTCTSQNLTTASTIVNLNIISPPSGGSIVSNQNGFTYNFSVSGISSPYTAAWDFGDGNTSSDNAPEHTYSGNGNYTVTVVLTNECGTETLTLSLTLNVGISENNISLLGLQPNPSEDLFTLVTSDSAPIDRIRITDMHGKVLFEKSTISETPVTLSAKNLGLKPGIYIIEVNVQNETVNLRLIVR
ncbi:MAG: PKD domain-containing protein [Flavobacteriales bacterium]|nr:PKD domain-containing protein [Flavobacteriales bacterium]